MARTDRDVWLSFLSTYPSENGIKMKIVREHTLIHTFKNTRWFMQTILLVWNCLLRLFILLSLQSIILSRFHVCFSLTPPKPQNDFDEVCAINKISGRFIDRYILLLLPHGITGQQRRKSRGPARQVYFMTKVYLTFK